MDGQEQTSIKDPSGAQYSDSIEASLPAIYTRTLRTNPFKLPEDNFILLRNTENEQKKLEWQRQQTLKVHENCSYAGRIRANWERIRQDPREDQDDVYQASSRKALSSLRADPPRRKPGITSFTDRDNISDYKTKRREMFLIEYSLAMRREGIQKLSEVASKEERCLRQAERFLDENATMFDDILKENEKNSVQAIKIAEQETKAKLEKVAEIKAILGKIVAVKSDISKNEEILKECAFYNVFLLKLSPPEWRERQQARTTMVDTIKASIKQRKAQLAEPVKPGRRRESMYRELPPVCDPRTPQSPSVMGTRETVKQVRKEVSEPVDESRLCEYEEPEIYFTDPQQLLDLLTDLEKQNLALIQYSREAEETLEGFSHTMENTRKKMEQETKQLTQQIDIMKHTIQREKDRVAELELKARLFSYGEYKAGDQDAMLGALGRKVVEVYRCCVGESGASLTTLQTLANIEGFLEELLEKVELVPRDLILVAARAREKERRLRLGAEKARAEKVQQEKRLLKTLERTQADVKRPTGKRLMPRSLPLERKRLVKHDNDYNDTEIEKHLYFFT